MFNLESKSEMRLLADRARRARKKAPVAFRVNPDVVAETHPYISTGLREHKFGVPIEEALYLYSLAAEQRWLEVRGISVHIGSQITRVQPFAATMGRVADLARELIEGGHAIRYIDAGGGLGVPYHHSQEDLAATAAAYPPSLLPPLHELTLHLLLTPGRSIVAPAGVLLTRVLYLKQNGEKRFAVVAAPIHNLFPPSLYKPPH